MKTRHDAPPVHVTMRVARVPDRWRHWIWRIFCELCAEENRNRLFQLEGEPYSPRMDLDAIVNLRYAYSSGLGGVRVFVGECPRCFQRYYGESAP